MGGAKVSRSEHAPFRSVPEFGQVPEYASEIPMSAEKSPNILQERETGSNFTNDSNGLWPEVAFVVGAAALTGDGEGLARKAR